MNTGPEPISLADDGVIPNSYLPLLVYRAAWQHERLGPETIESTFAANGWAGTWRNGVYAYHHYHSISHEVLGVYSGRASVQFGGPSGRVIEVASGDAVVIPAGVAHKRISATPDFRVVGAYPEGMPYDMCYGKPQERPEADRRIAAVPLPAADPGSGPGGPLPGLWQDADA